VCVLLYIQSNNETRNTCHCQHEGLSINLVVNDIKDDVGPVHSGVSDLYCLQCSDTDGLVFKNLCHLFSKVLF